MMIARLFLGVVVGAALSAASPALACPVCEGTGPRVLTLVQNLADSDIAVVAQPTEAPRRFRITFVIKGQALVDQPVQILAEDMPWNGLNGVGGVVLARHAFMRRWKPVGMIASGREDWLLALARMRRTAQMTPGEWVERVRFFAPQLDDPEPLIAETAYGEVARAPYAAMLELRGSLTTSRVESLLLSGRADRRALPMLLAGILGARDLVAESLRTALARGDTAILGAAITASLEIRGPAGLADIETFLTDRTRPVAQRRPGLMALRVLAEADPERWRPSVLAVYGRAIMAAADLAGYAAADLEVLSAWDMGWALTAVLERQAVSEADQLAILSYLQSTQKGLRVSEQHR
jgi:hypothetical protein